MNTFLPLIEDRITSIELGVQPKNLYEPIRYILSLGGKRLRPCLVMLGYGLAKDNPEKIVDQALVVEVFHNFTLMHDDIMDEAPLRRGQPTVHEKWNNTVAILSGDTMMVKAYDLLLTTPSELLPAAMRKFNTCAVKVCEGQQMDMNYEEREVVREDQYIEMIRLKTAVLLGFSLEYGGLLAGMSEDQQLLLREIGEKAGIGFQLMDDILDVYGDQAKFGKQVGGDIVANKKTFLLLKAMEMANEAQRQELERWIAADEFESSEKVKAVKGIYQDLGIQELAQEKMNMYYDEAFSLIEKLEASAAGKEKLIDFFDGLMKRER